MRSENVPKMRESRAVEAGLNVLGHLRRVLGSIEPPRLTSPSKDGATDVLDHGEGWEEACDLECPRHPEARALPGRHPGDVVAVENDPAGRRSD